MSDLYKKPTNHELWKALDDYVTDRTPKDYYEASLFALWLRKNRTKIKPCAGCDGDCGEDCATTPEQHWKALSRIAPPGDHHGQPRSP